MRASQIAKIMTANRAVHTQLRTGTTATLSRACAVLYAAQRNASDAECQRAASLWIATLRYTTGGVL